MEKLLSLKAVVSNEADKTSGQATIYLLEESSKTLLPILVDVHSAESIIIAQQNIEFPRPHTHDLVKRLLGCFGARLNDVLIYDLQDEIFYAYLRLSYKDQELEIDTRPSDAIAMAIRMSVPIVAKEEVLLRGGIKITENLVN